MGKRYYCDFCERSFADNAQNRKKHLNGVQHQRQKKIHYDSFRDAAAILADEMAKKPCKRFTQSGECEFGGGCRFTHFTGEDLDRLREQVAQACAASERKLNLPTTPPNVEVEAWLAKREERLAKKASTPTTAVPKVPSTRVVWTLPSTLQTYPKLPRSVYPPFTSDFNSNAISQWG